MSYAFMTVWNNESLGGERVEGHVRCHYVCLSFGVIGE